MVYLSYFLNILITLKYKTNMKIYCLVCRKNTENKDSKIIKTKNDRLQMRSQCSTCRNKKVDL